MTEVNINKVPSELKKSYIKDVLPGDWVTVAGELYLVLSVLKGHFEFAKAYSFTDKLVENWTNKDCECQHVKKVNINYEL